MKFHLMQKTHRSQKETWKVVLNKINHLQKTVESFLMKTLVPRAYQQVELLRGFQKKENGRDLLFASFLQKSSIL